MKTLIFLSVILLIINCQQQQFQPVPIQPIKLQTPSIIHQPVQQLPSTPSSVASTHPQSQFHNQLQLQQQNQQQIQQQQNQQLPSYIQQQLNEFTTILQLPITQTFQFIIDAQNQLQFKWNPSKQKQLKLVIDVFKIGSIGQFIAINDAGQNQYVQIYVRNSKQMHWTQVGKVYRTKMFTIDFINTDYKYLKFLNKYQQIVFIQVGIEQLEYVVQKGVKDDQLTLTRNKMHTILLQSQSTQVKRQHVYKWQWGYYQNQKQHQLEILGFTGVQLIAVLMTSIVQMYLLKGLLDNRAVV